MNSTPGCRRFSSSRAAVRSRRKMNARRKEVRDHQHTSCAEFDTPVAAGENVGLGKLEKAGFDDRVGSLGRESGRQLVQVVVGRRLAAAVGDQQDGRATYALNREASGFLGVASQAFGRFPRDFKAGCRMVSKYRISWPL